MSSSHLFPWHDLVTRERAWCESIVDAYGASGIVLTESTIDLCALSGLSHAIARTLGVLPLGVIDGRAHIATAAPLDATLLAELARSQGCAVVALLAASPLLPGAIDAAYAAAAGGALTLAGKRSSSLALHLEIVRRPCLGIPDWLEPVASTH